MKLTITNGIPAGQYTDGGNDTSEITLDLTITADATVAAPARAPALSAPVSNAGTHTVSVVATIGTTQWSATAVRGNDPAAAATFVVLTDGAGNAHPGLAAYFYDDCVDVGAVLASGRYDYAGALTVTYDGATIFQQASVQFPRCCLNQTIRYGTQATWHAVDRSLFPTYATPVTGTAVPCTDLTKYDFSYNGLGVATYAAMGTTGMRGDIAYAPTWDVPFVVQPSSDTFADVRKAADQSGAWPIYMVTDTGAMLDVETYPNASFMAYAQATFAGNPIAMYGDTASWDTSGTKAVPDNAHLTGYNIVAAAATGSARDKFHLSMWANYSLICSNATYRRQFGVWGHYQERATAWSLRQLFVASCLCDPTGYFARQLDAQRVFGEAQVTNPLGMQATYVDLPLGNGAVGIAPWEEDYTRLVLGVIAAKLPVWETLRARLASNLSLWLAAPQYQVARPYVAAVKDVNGAVFTTLTDVITNTFTGGSNPIWSATDIATLVAPTVTVAEVSTLILKYQPAWLGKPGDFAQYPTSDNGYPAILRAAVAANFSSASPEWLKCNGVPTKPDFSTGWEWNVVPHV